MPRWLILLGALTLLTLLEVGKLRAEEPATHRVVIPETIDVEVGTKVPVSVAFVPAEGFHIDRKGPLRIDLSAGQESGLKFKKSRLRWSDAVDRSSREPRFLIPIEGQRAGQETVKLDYRLWLCRAKICQPVRGSRSMQVQVKAPEPAPGDAGPGPAGDP